MILKRAPRSQAALPASSDTPPPPALKISFSLLKIPVHQNFVQSFIPSLWKSFTKFTRGISVLCITKIYINYWHDSRKIINFFVLPDIINPITSRSTTLIITKTSVTCGRTDAYPPTHPSVTAFLLLDMVILVPTNGDYAKSNTSLSKVVWTNATFLQLSCSFLTHITIIPNSAHHITAHLTHPVKHVNSHLHILTTLTCPHYIYFFKELKQNLP